MAICRGLFVAGSLLRVRQARMLLATTALCLPAAAMAQVVAANNATQVYTSGNGVQVVDIARADANGLSHNVFTQYNVPTTGIVLNNGTRDQLVRQSELAGAVVANVNLDSAAKVILNEVTGANRSVLAGFTEVLGGTASVIVANPYGITCSGCGFINSPSVTLTTGKPQFGANGQLQGFNVTTGDILVTGSGLNASGQDYLALLARKVSIGGQVNAKTVDVAAGVYDWDIASATATARAAAGAAPDYAIDSTILGGMYAGRIRFTATEAGVGVRVLGNVAATTGDFTISAAGKVTLGGAVSASNDVRVATTSADGIALDRASLTAGRDLALQATGGIALTGGTLNAAHDLTLRGASLTDTAAEAGAAGANRRHADGAIDLVVTGNAAITGTGYDSGKSLSLAAGALAADRATVVAGRDGKLQTGGALALGTSAVQAASGLELTSGGQFSTVAGAGQGVVSTAGLIILSAGGGLSNAGTVSADAGALSVKAGAASSNAGTLHGATGLAFGATDSAGSAPALTNTGRMLSEGKATLKTARLDNAGTIQGATGGTIDAGDFANRGTVALGTASGDAVLTVANLTNAAGGSIQSSGALGVTTGALDNAGKLLAGGALTVRPGAGANPSLFNRAGGVIQGGSVAITAAGSNFGNDGTLLADGAATLTLAGLKNTGIVQANGGLNAALGGELTNSGVVLAKGDLAVTAAALTNTATGQLQGAGTAGLTVTGDVGNAGVIVLGTGAGSHGTVTAATLTNNGKLLAGGDLAVTAGGLTNGGTVQSGGATRATLANALTNGGTLAAGGDLAITASDAARTLTVTNANGAYLQSGGTLTIAGTGSNGRNARIGTFGGYLIAHDAALTLGGSFRNDGWVQTDDGLSLDVADTFTNAGTTLARGRLTLTATDIRNEENRQLQGSGGAIVKASGTLVNAGTLTAGLNAGSSSTITAASISNKTTGTLQSGGDLAVGVQTTFENRHTVYTGGNLAITAGTGTDRGKVTTAAGATIQADGRFAVSSGTAKADITIDGTVLAGVLAWNADNVSVGSPGIVQAGGASTLTATGTFQNDGKALFQNTVTLTAASLKNGSGAQLQAVGSSSYTADTLSNDGDFYAASNGNATVNAGTLTNGGTFVAAKDLALDVGTKIKNTGALQAGDTLNLRARAGGALTVDNSGLIYAGDTLSIADSAAGTIGFSSQTGQLWSAKALELKLAALTNSGLIRSDGKADLTFTGALTNASAGRIALATGRGDATVKAASISNAGQLTAHNDLALTVGSTGIDNSGTVATDANLSIASAAASYAVGGTGQYLAGKKLTIAGSNANLRIGMNGQVSAASADLTLRSLSLVGSPDLTKIGGAITTTGDLTIDTGSFFMGGATTSIIGNKVQPGTTSITVRGLNGIDKDLLAAGFLFSGSALKLAAAGTIGTTSAGGINSLGDMTLGNGSGSLINDGSIFSGQNLTVLTGTVENKGKINSTGNFSATGSSFKNMNEIAAKGSIAIAATTISNIYGGSDPVSRASTTITTADADDSQGEYAYDFHGDITDGNYGDTKYYHRQDITRSDTFSGDPSTMQQPKIVADGDLTFTNFTQASNYGGILSGRNVTLSGLNNQGTFTNSSIAAYSYTYHLEWTDYHDCPRVVCSAAVPGNLTLFTTFSAAQTSRTLIKELGSSVYANVLKINAATVQQDGSPIQAGGSSASADGKTGALNTVSDPTGTVAALTALTGVTGTRLTGGSASATAAGTAALAVVAGATSASGATTIVYNNLVITLPTSINGQFVTSQSPTSTYLVETNPRFGLQGAIGSDFIAQRLGVNVDTLARRLGDAAYEQYLIGQQIAAQTGTAKLIQGETSDGQVQRLMQNAVDAASGLGLVYGSALTAEQTAKLDTDIVWMVKTQVNGQTVLAPVVYLSAKTAAMFDRNGAVMSGTESTTINAGTVSNTGGTISGGNLNITTKGDLTNTSGTITGGNVALKSTEGSIVNQTYGSTTGATGNQATIVGKQAGIIATNALNMDAAKNIDIKGATVTAGGDASLTAGNQINVGSIDKVDSSTTRSNTVGLTGGSSNFSTTTTKQELGSTVTVGGNLKTNSGGDTTIHASQVAVGGNADVTTGGNLNIEAGQNSTETHSQQTQSGAGVGGGVYGTTTTTTDEFHGRNAGSGFTVGGNLGVTAQGDMVVQGSNVAVGGNADVQATNVKVLQGNDVDTSTTTTNTTTYLRTGSSTESGTTTGASAGASAGSASAKAEAEAKAGAKNSNQGNLELVNNTQTNTVSEDQRAVGSTFTVGGNANIKATDTVTVQGSQVGTGGDLNIDAQKIDVLAAENKKTSTTTTTSNSVGFMADNENTAGVDANAGASASLTVNASAEAGAKAESDTSVDLYRNTQTTTTNKDVTHTGSSLTSGGNMSLRAKDDINVQGSTVSSGKDMDLQATNINSTAVYDVHETTTTTEQTGVGVYANGNGQARAGGEVQVTGATAGASAGAEGSAGLQVSHSSGTTVDGSTTANVSSFSSGGNMNRTATGTITDEGTQVNVGGNFTQSATDWQNKAVHDTTYSSSSSDKDTGRIGAYADAQAGAEAKAGVGAGSGADADASVGGKVSYEHNDATAYDNSSTARTSTINVGGNFSSTTSGKTSLEGTTVNAKGDASLTAGSLDYTAARDTHEAGSTENNVTSEAKVGVSASRAVKGEAAVGYDGKEKTETSDKAVVGGMTSGGNLTIKTTQGDANFEGTNLNAGGDGKIDSKGSVNFTAARDKESHSETSQEAAVGVATTKSSNGGRSGGVEVGGGFEHADEESNTARVGSMTSGGNTSITGGKDVNLEGTSVGAGGKVELKATTGDVNVTAAESTSSSHAYGASASMGLEAEKEGKDAPSGSTWQSATPNKAGGSAPGGTATPSGGSTGTGTPGGGSGNTGGSGSSSTPGSGGTTTPAPTGSSGSPTIGSQRPGAGTSTPPASGSTPTTGTTSTPAPSGSPTIGSQRGGGSNATPAPAPTSGTPAPSNGGTTSGAPTIGSQRGGGTATTPAPTSSTPAPSGGAATSGAPTIGSQRGGGSTTTTAPAPTSGTTTPSSSGSTAPAPTGGTATPSSGGASSGAPTIGSQRGPAAPTTTTPPATGGGATGGTASPSSSSSGSAPASTPASGGSGQPAAGGSGGTGWVAAKPGGAAFATLPEKKEDEPKYGGGGSVGGSYESTTTQTYQGSTITSGGQTTVSAGGDVNRQNVTTTATGGTTTQAGGKVNDTTKKDTSKEQGLQGQAGAKTSSANTGTGTADNAGSTGGP